MKFAKEDYTVYINYNSDDKKAMETKQLIEDKGGKAVLLQADIGNKTDLKNMLNSLPPIDVFIHNAVYAKTSKIESINDDEWEKSIAVNVTPLLKISQSVFPSMKEKGYGRIFAISSLGASRAVHSYTNIGVAKAAEEAMIRYIAGEWGKYGITANTISPGSMDTEAFRSVFGEKADERLDYVAKRSPLKRIVSFDEVSNLIYRYCQPELAMITGQNIRIDGGYSLLS